MLRSTEYFAFCDAVAGRYLHHTPHYEEAHAFHKPGYDTTLSHYVKKFGRAPPTKIWGVMGESGGGAACRSRTETEKKRGG